MSLHISTTPNSDPPTSGMRVTVEISVQIEQPESLSSFYEMSRSATPMVPLTPIGANTTSPRATVFRPASLSYQQANSIPPHLRAAFRAVASDAVNGYSLGMMSTFPQPPRNFTVLDIVEASRLADTVMKQVKPLCQSLRRSEGTALENFPGAFVAWREDGLDIGAWMLRIAPLRNTDKELYFFMRDALLPHTPSSILARLGTLQLHMADQKQTIRTLVYKAELEPRKRWTPLILEFYILILDYGEALARIYSSLPPYLGSLHLKLGAITTALRINHCLFRMTRDHGFGGSAKFKRQLKRSGITDNMEQLYQLVAQEFARLQDSASGFFEATERTLVSEPIRIETITEAVRTMTPMLPTTTNMFCTICQDDHPAGETVRTFNCQCSFGKECLDRLLNRDFPFSNTCPNCRTLLHEPLQWRRISDNSQGYRREMRASLLWALRSNLLSLKREIQFEPGPLPRWQRIRGWIRRLIF